jgi:putative ABC transport system ATP-binding protein
MRIGRIRSDPPDRSLRVRLRAGFHRAGLRRRGEDAAVGQIASGWSAAQVRGEENASGSAALTLEDVTVRRGNAVLLDTVTCQMPIGVCTVLVGPSGAGKSTLLRLLNRLDEPTSGTVRLHGVPLPSVDVLALRHRVGLVAQQPVMLADRVLDDLRVGCPDLDRREAAALLERVHLPAGLLGRGTADLSGGEAQRVCLARALAVGPQVLLLDEPTAALDAASAAAINGVVRDLVSDGLTVVLVSHDIAQARGLAGHALVLRGGRLVEHGPVRDIAYLTE